MYDKTQCIEPQYDAEGNVIPLDDSVVEQLGFGERVAEQVDASVEANRAEARMQTAGSIDAHVEDEGPRAWETDYHEKLETMDFDERVQATTDCLSRRHTFTDILYGLLGFCVDEKSYEEIEPYVESFTEFHRNRQEPRRYVFMLLRTGALEEIELGEDGNPLTEAEKQAAIDDGLDPDDVDTLVFDWRVVTTDVGKVAYDDYSSTTRFQKLLASDPEQEEAYIQIMGFCATPHYMGEIDEEFKGNALLGFDSKTSQMRQPSFYVDKLERSGVISWNGQSWVITDEGAACLKSREEAQKSHDGEPAACSV